MASRWLLLVVGTAKALETEDVPPTELSVDNASASAFWCKQSNICTDVCQQTAVQCPSHQCALHADSDCSTWHCVDTARADLAWLKYRTWRRATNFSCPSPLCSPLDFMDGLELGTDDANSCANESSSTQPDNLLQLGANFKSNKVSGFRVTVHGKEHIKPFMRFRLVDSSRYIICSSSLSELARKPSSSMDCGLHHPIDADVRVVCEAPTQSGWGAQSLFLEIKEHREPGLVWHMCSDFDSDFEQSEVLPFLDSCNVPELQAAVVKTDAYDAQEKTHGKVGTTVAQTVFGLTTVALNAMGLRGVNVADQNIMNQAYHGVKTMFGGVDGIAEDVMDKQEIAHMVKDLMSSPMAKISSDVNTVTNSVRMCTKQMVDNVQSKISEVGQDARAMMRKADFNSQLQSSFLKSKHRISVVLKLLTELNIKLKDDSAATVMASPVTKWLMSTANAGLHDCLGIAGLVPQISNETVPEVLDSLGMVNDWFTNCKTFSRIAWAFRPPGGEVVFNARHRVEQMLAREFVVYHKKAKTTSVNFLGRAEAAQAVETFRLRAQNFLNLVTAEHYHVLNNLVFPRRQDGFCQPEAIPSYGFGMAVGYTRMYSTGPKRRWQETCRYCRKDGVQHVHYGCWEEEALSFERCVASGGIHYNELLEDSNEYSCKQCHQGSACFMGRYGPRATDCINRPRQ